MAFIFPNIDPVILHFGDLPFKITWYSLSYVSAILLAWVYIKYLNKIGSFKPSLEIKVLDELITAVVLGIIIGGRLGYVLFYDLSHSLRDPLSILRTWEGGMSFHGGLIGVITASFIHCRIYKIKFFQLMDLLACAAPIGLFLGRIANFINAELYGRVSYSYWAVIFPGQVEPRHASQLYESFTEGLLLFLILFALFIKTKIQNYCRMISGLFLLFYAFFRTIIENYREPDSHIGFVIGEYTMGQLLSLPMIIVGVSLVFYSLRTKS
jgi:phosphatidylglycerol:prolipoprotein diacylglycerol transferase